MARILVTNDDGVNAPGLLALKQALETVAEVTVFAPDHNWSAAGHTKTMHKPLRVEQVTLADGSEAYTTTGAPSDCVALALLGVLPFAPDLVVAGINEGPNLGHDITYSGTVAGAMEAIIFGLPGIAISRDFHDPEAADAGEGKGDFRAAVQFAHHLVQNVLQRKLPANVLLNVNVPARPASEIMGVRVTRLGRRVYRDVLVERKDPRGRPYYWIGGKPPTGKPEDGTDVGAVSRGYISVTPLNMDMTDFSLLDELAAWELGQARQ